jgi:hypothetical protein
LQEETNLSEKIKFLLTALAWFKVAPCRDNEPNEKLNVFHSLGMELSSAMRQQGENQRFWDLKLKLNNYFLFRNISVR